MPRPTRAAPAARPAVLIASPLEPRLADRIRAAVPGVDVLHEPDLVPAARFASDHVGVPPRLGPAELERWRGLLARAEVMFDFDWHAPAAWRENSPRLRWIQGTSAGVGARAQAAGHADGAVRITTAAGVHAAPLAEFALAGLLHFVRGVPGLLRDQAAHRWGRGNVDTLRGRSALVVGAGSIGREVARVLDAFGVRTAGTTRSGRRLGAPFAATVPLEGLADSPELAAADILVLACPLTPATTGLASAALLSRLPRGALLVNLSRGPVLDQDALLAALGSGSLAGAVLDVADPEPLPAGHPLWNAPNVLISPHNAANVPTENDAIVELFVENLRRYLDGRPLRNEYDPARGY